MKYLICLIVVAAGCSSPKAETKIKTKPEYRAYPARMDYHCPYSSLDAFHRNLVDNSGGRE